MTEGILTEIDIVTLFISIAAIIITFINLYYNFINKRKPILALPDQIYIAKVIDYATKSFY